MRLEYPDPPLQSGHVRLRKWSMDDLACVAAASSDPQIPRGTTVPAEFTEATGRAWIRRAWARETSGEGLALAIAGATSDEACGLIFLGLRHIEGHCELGYWLVPAARGKGFGTQAVRLVSRWVLTQTSVYRLVAHVEPHNAASLAVLRKCGFQEEGLLRSYLRFDDGVFDAVSLSLLASDLAATRG